MTVISFPSSPTVGQIYLAANGVYYTWDGTKWVGTGIGGVGPTGATGATGFFGATGATGPVGTYEIITSNVTFYVATTGNDTTGTGSISAPWATPHQAMKYLRQRLILDGVTVTVSVADGTYTFTTSLNVDHPQGRQITITGGTTTGTRPTTTLNGGGIVGNTSGSLAYNDALLNAYYNTKWQFNGCHGIISAAGSGVYIDKVLIRGNNFLNSFGVVTNSATLASTSGSINLGTKVAVHNFYYGINTFMGGSINAHSATVTNCTAYAICAYYGGQILCESAVANNSGHGFLVNFNGTLQAQYTTGNYNTITGYQTNFGGSIYCGYSTANYNGIYGVTANFGGSIFADGVAAQYNAYSGIIVAFGGYIYAGATNASNNGQYGWTITSGGSMYAVNGTALGNGLVNASAMGAGYLNVTGSNYGGSVSPALNTVGNGNAYTAG